MAAIVLSGKKLAGELQAQLQQKCALITTKLGRAPKLAVVLVGEDPASQVYVAAKAKAAHRVGIETLDVKRPGDTSQAALIATLDELNGMPNLDGILLQLPLPAELDEFSAICRIRPELDVDGLHPLNQGLLMRGAVAHQSCTPLGSMALIDSARQALGLSLDLSGLKAIVVGRSVLVGKPISMMLLARNCTVTMVHSRTRELEREIGEADILVAALGKPNFIKANWLKPGAIVIDVGINRLPDGTIVGDVEPGHEERVAAYSPVPGGVGPMTITMLLSNTINAAENRLLRPNS